MNPETKRILETIEARAREIRRSSDKLRVARETGARVRAALKRAPELLREIAGLHYFDASKSAQVLAKDWAPMWRAAAHELREGQVLELDSFRFIWGGVGVDAAKLLFTTLLVNPEAPDFVRALRQTIEVLEADGGEPHPGDRHRLPGVREFFWRLSFEVEKRAKAGLLTSKAAAELLAAHPEPSAIERPRKAKTPSKSLRAGGRPKSPAEEMERDARIAKRWKEARSEGCGKEHFATNNRLTATTLQQILDRHRKREAGQARNGRSSR